MTLISPAYCTQSDIERYLSETGATEWADHDDNSTAEDGVYDDVRNQATEEINLYCQERYTPAALATSQLVNRWSTVFACYFLSQRRGNPTPDSLTREFDRIRLLLEKVLAGSMNIPGIPLRSDQRPTHDNLVVEQWHPTQKIRVQKSTSSDSPTSLTEHQSSYPQAFSNY